LHDDDISQVTIPTVGYSGKILHSFDMEESCLALSLKWICKTSPYTKGHKKTAPISGAVFK